MLMSVYIITEGIVLTDEGDGDEGDPQTTVETDEPLLPVNQHGDPRNGYRMLRSLQPRLQRVERITYTPLD